ncbi:hypothetical protein [Kingella oralis]
MNVVTKRFNKRQPENLKTSEASSSDTKTANAFQAAFCRLAIH